ncbi:MAG: chalcone isomerase family protein [Desulfovibrio sp.]
MEGTPLVLNGLALRSVFVFDVYVAGLYLPEKNNDAEAILNVDAPRRMVMHFVRDVGRDDLNKGWLKGLKKNSPQANDALHADFDAFCGMMRDIQDGEEMSFSYVPTKGTDITVGGENRGVILGKDFADALWRCWIGPNPDPGKSFRKELLGLN